MLASQSLNIVHHEVPADRPEVRLPGEAHSPRVSKVPADHIGLLNPPAVVTDRLASKHHIPGQNIP